MFTDDLIDTSASFLFLSSLDVADEGAGVPGEEKEWGDVRRDGMIYHCELSGFRYQGVLADSQGLSELGDRQGYHLP